MNGEFIYGLYFGDGDEKCFFYVGRSGRGEHRVPGVRFKEHQYHATYDTTPVYTFIREELDDYEVEWKEEILCWCSEDEATTNDTEFFWVQKILKDGHELKNAKNGDAKKFAEAAEAAQSEYEIKSPKDVAGYKKFNKDRIRNEKRSLLQVANKQSEFGCLDAKIDRNNLLFAIKPTKNPSKISSEVTYNDGVEAFNAGKYQMALNYVGGSYCRFQEMYGESYYDCVGSI